MFVAVLLTLKGWPDIGVPPLLLVSSYPACGLAGGLVIGALRRNVGSRRGAMLVGPIAAIPAVVVVMAVFIGSPVTWSASEIFGVVFTSIFLGVAGGYYWWDLDEEFPELAEPYERYLRERDQRRRNRRNR